MSREGSKSEQIVHTWTRRTVANATRRSSLTTLGATGLVALSAPFTAEAKKCRKKKKTCKKCPADLCPEQVAPCVALMTVDCGNQPICDDIIPCCDFLGSCDVNGFFTCLAQA